MPLDETISDLERVVDLPVPLEMDWIGHLDGLDILTHFRFFSILLHLFHSYCYIFIILTTYSCSRLAIPPSTYFIANACTYILVLDYNDYLGHI